MSEPETNLNEKYLAGEAEAEDVRHLEQSLADDEAVDALMSNAYMDVHLRELLCGSELGASIKLEMPQVNSTGGRRSSTRWAIAAIVIAAISGWLIAIYVVGELGDANTQIQHLSNRITELEKADRKLPSQMVHNEAPEIHSTRGWLMALPPDNNTDGKTLFVGTVAPLDQRLWTCPWGAAEFRYESGTSISIERNTTVTLNEADDVRQLNLERGIVHVTNLSDDNTRPTEIKSAHATVRLVKGQVAVQADGQQTAVEAAVNEVKVFVNESGTTRTFIVKRGHYLLIKPGEESKVMQGMLKLGLEPARK